MSMASWAERQGEVTSHSCSYGEELQRRISVQIASTIGDLESAIGIMPYAKAAGFWALCACARQTLFWPAVANG